MLKKIISIAVSSIAVLSFVGCSNQSPVSVSNHDNAPVKEAYFQDVQARDIGGAGGTYWAVHKTDLATQNDYYLYRFDNPTASWVKTSHWGKKVAVTCTGRCYHFNSDNTIWCCKYKNGSDSSGFVTNAPTEWSPNGPVSQTIIDIGAGTTPGVCDAVWVVCSNGKVYKGYVFNNVFQGFNYCWDISSAGGVPQSIGVDPDYHQRAYVGAYKISGTSVQAKIFYVEGASPQLTWQDIFRNNVVPQDGASDVAINGSELFYINYGTLYRLSTGALGQVSKNGLAYSFPLLAYIQTNGTPKYVQIN